MTRRSGKQKKKTERRRNGERNIEIECRAPVALARYNYARHQLPGRIVTVVCVNDTAIFRDYRQKGAKENVS